MIDLVVVFLYLMNQNGFAAAMPFSKIERDHKMDISIRIGGEAGQGIQSISSIIAKTFVRHDFYVFINQDFSSHFDCSG
jgi:hypothetical protein